MSEEEDAIGVIRREWVDDEHTRRLLKELTSKQRMYLRLLFEACNASSDPLVIRAHVKHGEASDRIKLFQTGLSKPKHKTPDPE